MDTPTHVYCYPVSRESAYVPLLFRGIEAQYCPIYRQEGFFTEAIAELAAGRRVIVHVHWEEFVLRACRTDQEAAHAAEGFERSLGEVRDRGGIIFWTVHNEVPHLIGFGEQFLRLRAYLARIADVILVHNATTTEILAAQVNLDRAKARLLPHPSYVGEFEDETALVAGLDTCPDRIIQGFGWVRVQKGFGEMIGMLPPSFVDSRSARIRISGEGVEAPAVIATNPGREDVVWDLRHVPNREVPALLRSACCLVLPYTRVLTSGIALVAMSVGVPLVAVDIPQFRDLLPPENHPLLFPRGDAHAFRRCIDHALSLSTAQRRRLVEANLKLARLLRPHRIAQQLAALFNAARRDGVPG
ncbi:glycosyltransferase [Lichenicoccus sp.]|uniref:glycosyltransferase n=1 Tax=Lichenicoccus sp. TaxID=2781899 RepID=UPI003D0E3B9E